MNTLILSPAQLLTIGFKGGLIETDDFEIRCQRSKYFIQYDGEIKDWYFIEEDPYGKVENFVELSIISFTQLYVMLTVFGCEFKTL